jgi:polyisoprenoid-binding protein YceI
MTATQDTTVGAQIYSIDKAHSEVSFQVRHLLTKVRGRFTEFSGTVRIDEQRPENSSVTLAIDASSVDTNTDDRDQHLRSADFFHVENHPTITFTSSQITKNGQDTYDLTGTLTIRGVSKEITFPVTHLGVAKDPWGNTRAGFEAATTVNRKDFGLQWNAALETGGFLVGDEVQIAVSIQAVAQTMASAA